VLSHHGFPVTPEQVEETLRSPDARFTQPGGRFVAQKAISERHVLRVVYREEDGMKVVYDREADILSIELAPERPIDHAEQVGAFIIHFDPENRPVLVEILDASLFVGTLVQASFKGQAELALEGAS